MVECERAPASAHSAQGGAAVCRAPIHSCQLKYRFSSLSYDIVTGKGNCQRMGVNWYMAAGLTPMTEIVQLPKEIVQLDALLGRRKPRCRALSAC